MKSLEKYFADWESHVFGLGYGTGERPVLSALKEFFSLVGEDPKRPKGYDYEVLEGLLRPRVTWLLINILGRNDLIEYGTSPRYAWLTKEGEALKAFVDSKTVDELCEACFADEHDYCAPDLCNCGPNGYEEGKFFCENPFWKRRARNR